MSSSTIDQREGAAPSGAERSGAELAALLVGVDTRTLDDYDLLEHVAATERLLAWVNSVQLAALADFARRPARVRREDDRQAVRAQWHRPGRWVREFAHDEVAARLRISGQDASARLVLGCALETLPRTKASLAAGRIDVRRARVLADETRDLDRATACEVENVLVEQAEHLPAARLKAKARAAVLDADPVAARHRATRAVGDRRVVVVPAQDGMADLWAHLPAVEAMQIKTAITAAARGSQASKAPGDDRTMDQRIADALVAPFAEALRTGELVGQRLGKRRGQMAELHVTVAASTLLGLDEAPAMLRGYGPVTPEVVRDLEPDARMRRILTDPRSGAVLDVGTTVYRPPADLLRFVEVRDQRCTFPGCGYPAVASEFEHTVPFPKGPTSAGNGGMRCKHHHLLKHSGPVRVEQDANGATRWTMPTGHVYDVEPPAVGPIHEGVGDDGSAEEGDLPPPEPPPIE